MKKAYKCGFLVVAATFVFLFGNADKAHAYAAYVSGPGSGDYNGWFWSSPTILVQVAPGDSASGTYGYYYSNLANDFGSNLHVSVEGRHTYRYYNQYPGFPNQTGLSVSFDGGSPIFLSGFGQDDNSPKGLFYTATVGIDTHPPQISLISPSNNTNTQSKTIIASGTASDNGSGISKVLVNGVVASLNGNSWSATVPLVNGLNTIQAHATDNAGRDTASTSASVLAQYSTTSNSSGPGSSGSATHSSTTPNSLSGANSSTTAPTASQGPASDPQSGGSKQLTAAILKKPSGKTSIIVLTALAALAVIVVALIKFGVISIDKSKFKLFKKSSN